MVLFEEVLDGMTKRGIWASHSASSAFSVGEI